VSDIGPPAIDGEERDTLVAFLEYLRSRVVAKLTGVDDVAARVAHVPSGASIYWLGTHMAAVELNQFQRILDGRAERDLVPSAPPPPEHDRIVDVIARYERACEESRYILATFPELGALGRGRGRKGDQRTARWVLVHMIEETARHAGHLDILREQLDGSAGR
jgi:hypothetical protein